MQGRNNNPDRIDLRHIVPEGTRRIPRHQFKNLEPEEIALPEGLEEIRAHAFRNNRLRRVVIPSTVRKIGFGAFSSCDLLEEVVLPEGLQSVGRLAFSECENLKAVRNYPHQGVGKGAFYEYRLSRHCCPWCGALLDEQDQCSAGCDNPYGWIGSLRLYKGLFWWTGTELVVLKVHCCPDGTPAYSVRFFGKESAVGPHPYEWNRLKEAGDPRVKGMDRCQDIPRGRVDIRDFRAVVFLHPELTRPDILSRIMNEFGLCRRLHPLDDIRIVSSLPDPCRTGGETR